MAESKRSLLITRGAGRPVRVDREAAEAESGTLRQVLPRLVRDSGLLDELDDPLAVVELFADGRGETVESAVSPADDWRKLLAGVDQDSEVELCVARRHLGGGGRP